jgi:hypothetical protein
MVKKGNREWKPAKTRAAVSSIQEHIMGNPRDAYNMYYFITPDYIFDNISEVKNQFIDSGFVVPEKVSDVSHDTARLFIAVKYGIDPRKCMDIEVGKFASVFGWGVALPEKELQDHGIDLIDWDYESFLSKEVARKMNNIKSKSSQK